ncbi:uncharacterized protein LOC123197492 [Mangifera indica]|uniref:uncharacterized protein LOC123197492 n=1 Tax=Mangifera indica TaxID=29780 RepID=UPI001CF97C60|nr:uncharacterized protein LOC123197492 [Mangifera indica]
MFDGENDQVWAVRMEAFLDASDFWEVFEEDYEVHPLSNNPTLAQLKSLFTKIMTLKSTKAIWSFLKEKYDGNERIKGMQVQNMIWEFEMQRMKELETINEYFDILFNNVNRKIFVVDPEKFKATIFSLENSKDLSSITLEELLNALQAQKQRRLLRLKGSIEGAWQVRVQINHSTKTKKKKGKKENANTNANEVGANDNNSGSGNNNKNYPPCQHCSKKGHHPFKCWRRPNARCNKCNHIGHHEKIYWNNIPQKNEAKVVNKQEVEEQLFVPTCFVGYTSSEVGNLLSVGQLLDKGCKVIFENKKCPIKDANDHDMFKIKMRGKNFSLDLMENE